MTLFTVGTTPAQSIFTFQPITNLTAFRYVRYLGPANGSCNVAEVKFYGNSYATSLAAVPTNPVAVAGDALVSLSWSASSNAAGYNVKRSTTNAGPYAIVANVAATSLVNTGLTNGTAYYYVVSATNGVGESVNSVQVSAQPVSTVPPQINFETSGGQLQLTWPADHTGWRMQVQTNSQNAGLGTNWVTVPGSTSTNQSFVPMDPVSSSVFFRLVYP